jgi:AraC-like DNA-binding protein
VEAFEHTRRNLVRGWTEIASRAPHPVLRGSIVRYWSYEEHYGAPVRRRELPSSEIVVTFGLGPGLRVGPVAHTSFVAGLTETSIVTEMDGDSDAIQVNLTPLGARRLFRVPMEELANRVLTLDDVFGRATGTLLERLGSTRDYGTRFAALDEALASLIERSAIDPALAWAWSELVRTRGRVAVSELARQLGWSRGRLVAGFRDWIGLRPKTAARVLRFEHAIELVSRPDVPSWREVAFACGYADQAHFNRDFKQFAGSTPTEYVSRRHPDGLGLAPQ